MTDADKQAKALAQGRRKELVDAMRHSPDRWTSGRVVAFYQANGWGRQRHVARQDLRHLTEMGLLTEHGPENDRSYSLNPAKEGYGWHTPVAANAPRRRRHSRR